MANEFDAEFTAFQKSSYARRFKTWTPLVLGAVFALPASVVSPAAGVLLAAGGVLVEAIKRYFGTDTAGTDKVFNMLSDLREDLIERSQVAHLA